MLTILCCFQSGRPRQSLTERSGSGSESNQRLIRSQKFDVLNNEGSDLQDDLWNLCFRARVQSSKGEDYNFYQNLSRSFANVSFESSLGYLSELYTERGFARHVPRLKSVLETVAPFNRIVSIMIQSNPQIAALVWGCVQVVFQVGTQLITRLFSD